MSRIDSSVLEGRGPHPPSSLPGVTQDLARMVRQRAVLTGAINAGLNFWLQYRRFAPRSQVPLTVDQISSRETTVFGTAIPMALFMSVILTVSMIWAMRKRLSQAGGLEPRGHVFSTTLKAVGRNAFFSWGVLVSAGILLQRVAGTLWVSGTTAAALMAFTACVLSVSFTVSAARAYAATRTVAG